MESAERDDIFVADLLAYSPALSKAKMMGVGGLAVTD